jgi:hypothetical protein
VEFHRDDLANFAKDAAAFAQHLSAVTLPAVEAAGNIHVGNVGQYTVELAFVQDLASRYQVAHRGTADNVRTLISHTQTASDLAGGVVDAYDRAGHADFSSAQQLGAAWIQA